MQRAESISSRLYAKYLHALGERILYQNYTIPTLYMESSSMPKFKLIVVGATWCQPCKALAPILEAIAKDILPVEKLDIEEHAEAVARLQVRSVPALFFYRDEQIIAQRNGSVAEADLRRWLASLMLPQV